MTNAASTALSPAEVEEFRNRCESFLSEHAVAGKRRDLDGARAFQGKLAEAGLAGLPYTKEYGGAGLTDEHDRIFRAVSQRYPEIGRAHV